MRGQGALHPGIKSSRPHPGGRAALSHVQNNHRPDFKMTGMGASSMFQGHTLTMEGYFQRQS